MQGGLRKNASFACAYILFVIFQKVKKCRKHLPGIFPKADVSNSLQFFLGLDNNSKSF